MAECGEEPGRGPAPGRLHRPGTRRDQGVSRAPPWPPCWPGSVSRPRRGRSLEEDLGRGLLDELAARQDQRLAPAERARLRELTAELERLDKLVETTPKDLDQAERAKRFEDLKRQRELASIALGEFQTKLVEDHGRAGGPGRQAERNPGRAARRCRPGRLGRYRTRGTERGRPRRRALGRGRPLPGHPGLGPDRGDRSGRAVDQRRHRARGPSPDGAAEPARRRHRRTCGPWSSDYAPSASSRWPRPWAPRPTASRRPGG